MATSPLPSLPPEEVDRQVAGLRSQATELRRQANEVAQKSDSTTDDCNQNLLAKHPLMLFLFCAVASWILVWVYWPNESSKKPATPPTQTKQTATTPTQPVPEATEPAKPLPAKPQAEPVTKKAEASKSTTTPVPSSPSLVSESELKKLRSEIEGLKNRLPATPVTPAINFPPEITVRLVPSQDGSQPAVKSSDQPVQPAGQPERRRLSSKEKTEKFWQEYISRPDP